jgi:anaerobic ribonucleoside-triphosphate reductase activating protein
MGGEPLSKCSDNRKVIIGLCKEVKERFPDKNIWCWSGYTFEDIANDPEMSPILDYIDVLVDGAFIREKKDLSTPFRGSTNQRIIKVDEWRKTGNVVEMEFGN